MKSTLKIATSRRGTYSVPVIKIIQPVEYVNPKYNMDIDDIKDQLISEFLHTPCMAHRNQFFRLDTVGPLPSDNPEENKLAITTIAPIEESELFYDMKLAMLYRFISEENIYKINEFKSRISGDDKQGPVPFGLDVFEKINEFFDWIYTLNYNGDPVNTPIDVKK